MDRNLDPNTNQALLRSILVALFDLARANLPATVDRLGGRLGLSPELTRRSLARLERDGLADAARVRLTLVGLAVATHLAAQRAARATLAA